MRNKILGNAFWVKLETNAAKYLADPAVIALYDELMISTVTNHGRKDKYGDVHHHAVPAKLSYDSGGIAHHDHATNHSHGTSGNHEHEHNQHQHHSPNLNHSHNHSHTQEIDYDEYNRRHSGGNYHNHNDHDHEHDRTHEHIHVRPNKVTITQRETRKDMHAHVENVHKPNMDLLYERAERARQKKS